MNLCTKVVVSVAICLTDKIWLVWTGILDVFLFGYVQLYDTKSNKTHW